jgi:hypothetical protein
MPPLSHSDDPAHWRQRAVEAHRMAEAFRDPVAKQLLLEIADAYERLTKILEARQPKSPT